MKYYLLNNIKICDTNLEKLHKLFSDILISEECNLITTFNLDFLRIASCDLAFKEICKNSFLNLPDGFGITSLLKLKYNIKIQRITGNDLFPLLLSITKELNLKVAIIGGNKKVSDLTKIKILEEYNLSEDKLLCLSPKLNFEFDKEVNKQITEQVVSFKPDIVLAALGCPRQEKWLYKNMKQFNSKINIGIGATLDFYMGEKIRSPEIFQKIGLEWFWRLLNEPTRLFKRYILKDLPFYIKNIYQIFFRENGKS